MVVKDIWAHNMYMVAQYSGELLEHSLLKGSTSLDEGLMLKSVIFNYVNSMITFVVPAFYIVFIVRVFLA